MDSAFTPGPWEQSHRQTANGMYSTQVYDAAGSEIATCSWYPVKTEDGIGTNREANARLIAAAPDLLAALQTFVEKYVEMVDSGDCGFWDPETEEMVIAARTAIAKATQ